MRYRKIHILLVPIVLTLIAGSMTSCLKDIKDTLESPPTKLEWDSEIAFPLGEERFGFNDIRDITLLDYDTVADIPNWVKQYSIPIEGSIEFDLASFNENTDQIKSILMRVNIYNGYPDDLLAQAYFRGPGQTLIDSMFEEGAILVPGGTVKDNGAAVDPTHAREDAQFDRDRLDAIQDATEIILQAIIPLTDLDSSLVLFYPDYHIDVQIGIMLDLSIKFE